MSSASKKIGRRDFLKLTAAGLAGAALGIGGIGWYRRLSQPEARVAILKESSYENDLVDTIRRGIALYPDFQARVKDSRVVLKPNFVDYYPGHPINTHPAIIAAAIAVFRRLGAREVIVAEGPGHKRDTEMMLEKTGLDLILADEQVRFIDLNLDAISPVKLVSSYTGLSELFFPHTILGADLVVSMPKLKTHHWAGATLSLKNLFGAIPGVKYGWPKNYLHWYGIANSIADIALALKPDFAIIDGIQGMEGDGPLHGSAVQSGVIVMGDNLTAVDATAARVMGLYPENLQYLRYMLPYGGAIHDERIEQLGEPWQQVQQHFKLIPITEYAAKKPAFIRQALISGW